MLTREDLEREAAATGFHVEPLEKAIRLLELLESLRSHPFLAERMALKGGTALNLFVFDAPRLSVDVDLNYIGAADREAMLADRPKVEQAIRAVCGRLCWPTRIVSGPSSRPGSSSWTCTSSQPASSPLSSVGAPAATSSMCAACCEGPDWIGNVCGWDSWSMAAQAGETGET
jgi:hypothetical protein